MRSIELFSGCGGLALGLSRAGFHHELMVEWNGEAVTTIRHNKSNKVRHVRDWPIEQADVREVNWTRFHGTLDLVAGGPPCQPFSIGGKHQGHTDGRDMWPQAIRAVRQSRPKAFLFENVKGLTRASFSEYLAWIVASLERPSVAQREGESYVDHLSRLRRSKRPVEYKVLVAKVNAADFGAPQKRHRVIIAGVHAELTIDLQPPVTTHSRERLLWDQWVSGSYWTRHNLRCPKDGRIDKMDRSLVAKLRLQKEPPAGLPWVTLRDALVGLGIPSGSANHVFQDGARVYPGHTGSPLDQPAKALKAGDHGVPGGENMMVRDDGTVRYLTVREAARLQGLPDDYLFPRSWTESMRQLGNAVTSRLGESIGSWMGDLLRTAQERMREAA